MIRPGELTVTRQRELALKQACRGLAHDLRGIEPVHYFLFFELGEMPAVYDKVSQHLDSHFPNGSCSFACTGAVEIGWSCNPAVAVDLEFSGEEVLVFYRLTFNSQSHEVELHHISFQQNAGDPNSNTQTLSEALKMAQN